MKLSRKVRLVNRAQRRAAGAPKEPTYTLTRAQIQEIKKGCTNEALDTAFKLMLSIPVMVIHDKFNQIMKKEGREETFIKLVLETYECFNDGYVTLDDLQKCLKEEAGVTFEDEKQRKIY